MATVVKTKPIIGEERFVLTDVSWEFYQTCCRELDGRQIRLSYDRGALELMITLAPHEYYKTMLAKLVEATVLVKNIPVRSGGSMTFQRKDLEKGFEPDDCWWIAHEAEVRGKSKFNFRRDPPPDLAIEVEITSSLVSRIGIYAALKVPEIWRFDGKKLRFCILDENGEYQNASTSLSFPFLRPADLLPYLRLQSKLDETTRVRKYMDWLAAI